MKYRQFLVIAKHINLQLNVKPLLFGSLGLERRLRADLNADDIDVLLPEHYLHDGWVELCSLMESLGYELYDLHEHAFVKEACSVAFASIEGLAPFAGVDIATIPTVSDSGAEYLLLGLPDYQKVYKASSKDGYRVNKKEKKDNEKLALISKALNKWDG